MTTQIIQAKSAVIGGKLLQDTWLEVSDGIITSINAGVHEGVTDRVVNGVLVPGFVDMHCHGGGGKYFSDEEDSGIQMVIDTHREHGTTSMLASLVTEPIPALKSQIERLVPFVENGSIAGIHLEGPYLSRARCGAHEPSLLRTPSLEELKQLLDAGDGHIKMITLAPELPQGIEAVAYLVEQGVVVALGHSDADFATAVHAMDAGASVITHFYNGLPLLDHHKSTITAAGFVDTRVVLELILDGHHVNNPAVALLFKSASSRVALVTDAMSAAGANDGDYMIGSLDVVVDKGVARLRSNNSLAGSTLTMDRAFFNLCNFPGKSIVDAVFAASTLPARALGLTDQGDIVVGKRADLLEVSIKEQRLTHISA